MSVKSMYNKNAVHLGMLSGYFFDSLIPLLPPKGLQLDRYHGVGILCWRMGWSATAGSHVFDVCVDIELRATEAGSRLEF